MPALWTPSQDWCTASDARAPTCRVRSSGFGSRLRCRNLRLGLKGLRQVLGQNSQSGILGLTPPTRLAVNDAVSEFQNLLTPSQWPTGALPDIQPRALQLPVCRPTTSRRSRCAPSAVPSRMSVHELHKHQVSCDHPAVICRHEPSDLILALGIC